MKHDVRFSNFCRILKGFDGKGTKAPSGALQFVVFTSVVIAVLLAAFVALTHVQNFFKKQSHVLVETVNNADHGIEYALLEQLNINDSVSIVLSEQEFVSISREYWGIFEKVSATAKSKKKRFTKTALAGGKLNAEDRPALYLRDNNKPLILAGNTKIEGTAYVAGRDVRPGSISGNAYHGTQLIYGAVKESNTELPELRSGLLAQLDRLTAGAFYMDAHEIIPPFAGGELVNSFSDPTTYLYSNTRIDLAGTALSGNIWIYAKEKIVVSASARLSDVILTAPEIEIRAGVKGNFQAIASKKLTVGNNVSLHYPSALVVQEKQAAGGMATEKEDAGITIGENSIIKGVVLLLGREREHNFSAQLVVEPQAVIYGELYCKLNATIKGTVNGSVYASNFISHEAGTIYQHHLFNATISAKSLPDPYVGFLWNNAKKEIVKWLY